MKNELSSFNPADYIPQLSIDFVIFTYQQKTLKVLTLRPRETNVWVLPSGFIFQHEDVEEAANRNLKERTGIEHLFLRQFYTFGKASRYFPELHEAFRDTHQVPQRVWDWITQRFVTIGYYALVEFSKVNPVLDVFSEEYKWLEVDACQALVMDHADIVYKAREVLSTDMMNFTIAANLLPELFTLPELQKLYEAVLGRTIDRGNFRKKVIKEDILEKLEKQKTGGAHRSPYLYTFKKVPPANLGQEAKKFGF